MWSNFEDGPVVKLSHKLTCLLNICTVSLILGFKAVSKQKHTTLDLLKERAKFEIGQFYNFLFFGHKRAVGKNVK